MFKVSARTILHLGAELISSDAVAFYELIKNSFDAGSPRVKIEVLSRVEYENIEAIRELMNERREELKNVHNDAKAVAREVAELRSEIEVKEDAPEAEELLERIDQATTFEDLESILDDANRIVISDMGEGMSKEDLEEIYLTIGTPKRLEERAEKRAQPRGDASKERPILGEKGIGRLSVMRLGWKVHIETTKAMESHWSVLDIDWHEFEDLDRLIGEIPVAPRQGEEKPDPSVQGTVICISALAAPWDKDKLAKVAREELAKFMDPFVKDTRFPISIRFNGEVVVIPRLQDLLFEHAHMKLTGRYIVDTDDIRFEGEMWVRERLVDSDDKLIRTAEQLRSLSETSETALRRLGSFEVVLYWFNRRIITAIDGIGDRQQVRDLQKQWGGIMLFRDGFRIHPYGGVDDDWLHFDRTALNRSGYKLNKDQFIGKIDITREGNPYLIDQSNREGLKDTSEKQALINIIHNLIQTDVWRIMVKWEKEAKQAKPAKVIENKLNRVKTQVKSIRKLVQNLATHAADQEQAQEIEQVLQDSVEEALSQAQRFVEHADNERSVMMHLAGIGLLVEILAHELTRATTAAVATLVRIQKSTKPEATSRLLKTLHAQLKTLEKRLRMLDPLSTSGRQHKERFDLIDWTEAVLDTHAEQFEADHIDCPRPIVVPERPKKGWTVRMVKGMYVQVLENLLSNSIYWLRMQRQHDKKFRPELRVVLDPGAGTIRVTDNGPGIPYEQAEDVFTPFFTTKPPGESRGLGLYIVREIGKYHGIEVSLSDEPKFHANRYNSVVITLSQEESV